MSVIWKYNVPAQETFEIKTPGPAQPLSVQMQADEPKLWMLVTPSALDHTYRFRVLRTGDVHASVTGTFVGTFQPEHGLVFHLFLEAP